MRTTPARRLTALAALALVATTAVACGGDGEEDAGGDRETVVVTETANPDGTVPSDDTDDTDDTDDDSGTPSLTQEQTDLAALAPENFSADWTQEEYPEDDNVGAGCIGEVDVITNELQETARTAYSYTWSAGVPIVYSSAQSYATEEELVTAFEQAQAALDGCTSAQGTDSEGNEWDMTVTYSDEITSDTLDGQINLVTSGTLTDTSGEETSLSQSVTIMRMGPNIVQIGMVDIGDESGVADAEAWAEIGVQRLVDVILESEPTTTQGPDPV